MWVDCWFVGGAADEYGSVEGGLAGRESPAYDEQGCMRESNWIVTRHLTYPTRSYIINFVR